ncbi:MAG: acetyl-CoA carboxylase carboxyltransferase subunit alpha [Cytophagales bacterium]|jgi:acetyl-CoA carboxylase carboxyl transferase subunit alpha|nr:acetyl-CoA carboxylase carboxyltransferase subunit alpha [Cytophagales bacterium]
MILDFEKPIKLLNDKLDELKKLYQQKEDTSLGETIKTLSEKIKTLTWNTFKNISSWQKVQVARHSDRPYTLDYINLMVQDFIEIHGDRLQGDDKTIIGGLGKIDGKTIMFIGHQKGGDLRERQKRNFWMASPCGYRKSLRLMKMAEHFEVPVVIFIDMPGANLNIDSEKFGIAEAIAKNLQAMVKINVPLISFVIGEGGSGGALALAMGDKIFMLENSWFSVISPESAATILCKNSDYKEQMSMMLHLTAKEMLELKIIDDIVNEPLGGVHSNISEMSKILKIKILKEIRDLERHKRSLLKNRWNKYLTLNDGIEKIFMHKK